MFMNACGAILLGIITAIGLQIFIESAWELYKISKSE